MTQEDVDSRKSEVKPSETKTLISAQRLAVLLFAVICVWRLALLFSEDRISFVIVLIALAFVLLLFVAFLLTKYGKWRDPDLPITVTLLIGGLFLPLAVYFGAPKPLDDLWTAVLVLSGGVALGTVAWTCFAYRYQAKAVLAVIVLVALFMIYSMWPQGGGKNFERYQDLSNASRRCYEQCEEFYRGKVHPFDSSTRDSRLGLSECKRKCGEIMDEALKHR